MSENQGTRLTKARLKAGFETAADAARAFGWKEITYRAHESNGRGLKKEVAMQYGKAFKVSPAWLLTGEITDSSDSPKELSELPLLGVVEAGTWREADNMGTEPTKIAAPRDARYPKSNQYLLEVRGISMDRCKPIPLMPGTLIRCVDFRSGEISLKTGQIVVVERKRDGGHLIETTVKRVSLFADRTELHPESSSPAHQPITIYNTGHGQDRTTIEVIAIVTAIISEIDS